MQTASYLGRDVTFSLKNTFVFDEFAIMTELYFGISLNEDVCDNSFICLVCDIKFLQEDMLKIHLLNHEQLELNPLESISSVELISSHLQEEVFVLEEFKILRDICFTEPFPVKYKEIYVCSVCGKEFKRKDHLNKHSVVHSDKRPHICLVCGKSYARKDRLREHCVLHLSNGWSCYFCGKMFSQRCILRKHERIHRGVKPFSCELCDRQFSRKNDLTRHTTSHTGEKDHFCVVCGKGFSQKRLMKRHELLHSRIK